MVVNGFKFVHFLQILMVELVVFGLGVIHLVALTWIFLLFQPEVIQQTLAIFLLTGVEWIVEYKQVIQEGLYVVVKHQLVTQIII